MDSQRSRENPTKRELHSFTEAADRVAQRPLFLANHDAAYLPLRHVAATDCDIQRTSSGRALNLSRGHASTLASTTKLCVERSRHPTRSERGQRSALLLPTPAPPPIRSTAHS